MSFLKDLGFNVDDPLYHLAEKLVKEDYELIEALVRLRKSSNMTLQDVAKRTGGDPASISRFENHERDAHLSTIRAYAHAVRASISHVVEPLEEVIPSAAKGNSSEIRQMLGSVSAWDVEWDQVPLMRNDKS